MSETENSTPPQAAAVTDSFAERFGLHRPVVMGIVNLTPDSFHRESRAQDEDELLQLVEKHVSDGATILDLGAASSRPGAQPVPAEIEADRVTEAIGLMKAAGIRTAISVDTYHSIVVKAAVAAGATMVNDISAGEMDAEMFATVANLKVPYIMMHMQGTPATMQQNPTYENVVQEVFAYFEQRIALASAAGIEQVVVDPGFGFGKTVAHNYQLLAGLDQLAKLGRPILAGVSRKSMINKVLGTTPAQALNGTTVVNTLALQNGANILRVHDVKEAMEAIQIVTFTRNCTT